MASIVLSFVGQQDPFAKTETEGSIVTLVRHLIAKGYTLKRVFLLHTDSTEQNAIDTCQWLMSEVLTLAPDTIELLPVSDAFSHDPVNPFLATQEARKAVHQARTHQASEDFLEFNASSGTPAMKTAWSVLQALGYASARSHVWQVRNPKEMRPRQAQVFYSNVNLLRDELDLKVIKQQIQDYNYSGALITLQESNLLTLLIKALLEYGYYRISMDFDRAFSCLNPFAAQVDPQWLRELAPLRQKDQQALLKEAYFNALVKLQNQKYADFLVILSGLQENILRFLVTERVGLQVSSKYSEAHHSWQQLKQAEQGELYQHLQTYRLPKGDPLRLDTSIGRYVMIAILDYYPQYASLIQPLKELNDYCDQRNALVHEFVGVSAIEDESTVLRNLHKVIKQVTGTPDRNPFDLLNQQLCDWLDRTMQSAE